MHDWLPAESKIKFPLISRIATLEKTETSLEEDQIMSKISGSLAISAQIDRINTDAASDVID
jgi:hypothetical protein